MGTCTKGHQPTCVKCGKYIIVKYQFRRTRDLQRLLWLMRRLGRNANVNTTENPRYFLDSGSHSQCKIRQCYTSDSSSCWTPWLPTLSTLLVRHILLQTFYIHVKELNKLFTKHGKHTAAVTSLSSPHSLFPATTSLTPSCFIVASFYSSHFSNQISAVA